MKAPYLTILIITLYILAALSMLGVGSNREKLKKLHQQEQIQQQEPEAQLNTDQAQAGAAYTLATKEKLQSRLTTWQLVALGLFGAASLLLVLKDRLVKKPANSENSAGGKGRR